MTPRSRSTRALKSSSRFRPRCLINAEDYPFTFHVGARLRGDNIAKFCGSNGINYKMRQTDSKHRERMATRPKLLFISCAVTVTLFFGCIEFYLSTRHQPTVPRFIEWVEMPGTLLAAYGLVGVHSD